MTALQERPTTVLRAEVVPEEAPAVQPRRPAIWPRVLGPVLILIALLTVWTVSYLFVLSRFPEARAQKSLYAQLRSDLANHTAPVAEPVDLGRPIALLDAPAAGIHHLVVVEGTAPDQLQDGPGHLRSTALPGQTGISVVMGRSLSYGAPFAHLDALRGGDVITVSTGQGRFRYRVVDSRDHGGITTVPASTSAMLTLVTSHGTGWLSALAPASTLYVDAVITGTPQLRSGAADAPSGRELPMSGDHTFGTLAELALLMQLFAVVLAAVTWARTRWSPVLTHVVAVPVVLASLWLVTDVATRLLPNLL